MYFKFTFDEPWLGKIEPKLTELSMAQSYGFLFNYGFHKTLMGDKPQ